MKRILLLCFIHGFKGDDDTFRNFPKHLQDTITSNLPDDRVASVVYPKYETKGELAISTAAFLEWLKEQVMTLRKEHLENPWPPNDRSVGVILVAHSMGGFVASDCLFQILDARRNDDSATGPIFPLIQGILAFDTPYNGLARSMFVYGAFSNYQKVSNVFNVMTALSAAAPATLSRLASKRAVSATTKKVVGRSSNPAWKTWQLIAVRTGTVGAIAAGGVAAYTHRKEILEGMRSVRNLKKEDVVQGYQQSVDALGQGLAYINKGNVGESFAWLSDHFTFVGALVKQNELNRRLERLAALKGVGVRDYYASLGENGYWSGGYFVPERTFCAIPGKDQPAVHLFNRHVVDDASDEIEAHINLFKEKNPDYERMLNDSARLAVQWFDDETEIYDDPKFAEPPPAETKETEEIAKAVEDAKNAEAAEEKVKEKQGQGVAGEDTTEDGIPDASPIDIAAAASLVPLPDDDAIDQERDGKDKSDVGEQKKAYMRHLFGIAQATGTNLWSNIPSRLPAVDMPKVSMPSVSMPSMPSMPAMPSMSMPRGFFSKRSDLSTTEPKPAEGETTSGDTPATSGDTPAAKVEEAGEEKDKSVSDAPDGEVAGNGHVAK